MTTQVNWLQLLQELIAAWEAISPIFIHPTPSPVPIPGPLPPHPLAFAPKAVPVAMAAVFAGPIAQRQKNAAVQMQAVITRAKSAIAAAKAAGSI